MGNILIVDDEPAINDLILMNLTLVGHTGVQAFDGKEALEVLKENHFDLCLLDIMLPGQDGFQLISNFNHANIPVIYLSAKSSVIDRVKGLNLGAEDYIIKPFETLELLARIDVVLRRNGKINTTFYYKDVEIKFSERLACKANQNIDLTAQEFALLEVNDTFLVQLSEYEIHLTLLNTLGTMKIDRTLIHMLLCNLIKNSIQATKKNGTIRLRAYLEGKSYILEVSDNGCGIPKNKINEVMKPFFRVDKSRSRKTGGAGLGLSICKSIADLHHAEIIIDSEFEKGTCIKIIFYNSVTTSLLP